MKTRLENLEIRKNRGTAMIVVLGIVAILLIYSVGNVRTLNHLGREIRLVNEIQNRSWAAVKLQRTGQISTQIPVTDATATNLDGKLR